MKNETKVSNSNSVDIVSNDISKKKEYKSKKEIDVCSDESTENVEDIEIIIDDIDLFGKCRIVADSINTYRDKELIKKNINEILNKDETFYFDKLHNTNKGNTYVSWGGFNGKRIYAPYKTSSDECSPVIRIAE